MGWCGKSVCSWARILPGIWALCTCHDHFVSFLLHTAKPGCASTLGRAGFGDCAAYSASSERSIQAVCSWMLMRWVRRSAVGSSLAF